MNSHQVFKIVFAFIFLFFASQANAINKCVVNGKTIYQNGSCPKDADRPFVGSNISEISSEGLRTQIAIKEARKAKELEVYLASKQRGRGSSSFNGQIEAQRLQIQGQQMHMQSQMNRLENQIQLQQIQQNMNQLMR